MGYPHQVSTPWSHLPSEDCPMYHSCNPHPTARLQFCLPVILIKCIHGCLLIPITHRCHTVYIAIRIIMIQSFFAGIRNRFSHTAKKSKKRHPLIFSLYLIQSHIKRCLLYETTTFSVFYPCQYFQLSFSLLYKNPPTVSRASKFVYGHKQTVPPYPPFFA